MPRMFNFFSGKLVFILLGALLLLIIGLISYVVWLPPDFLKNSMKGIKQWELTVDKRIEGKDLKSGREKTLLLEDFFLPLHSRSSPSTSFLRFNIKLALQTQDDVERLKGDIVEIRKTIYQLLRERAKGGAAGNTGDLKNKEVLEKQLLVALNKRPQSIRILFLNIEKFMLL